MNPKVSIILPAYNRAGYIIETIGSIRAQTHSNWELIIIDDGSEDNTEELVRGINDERILFHKAGRIGVRSKVKNIGLARATGDMIAFIDSDDLWERTKLEKQLKALEDHPEAGFCVCGGYNFKIKDEPFEFFYEQRTGSRYGELLIPLFRAEVSVFNQALLVKKRCVEEVGNFNENTIVSDVDFVFALASRFKAVIIYEPLFFRRLHDQNYSGINRVKRHYEGLKLISSYKEQLPPGEVRNTLFRSHIHFGEDCLKYNEHSRSIASFFKAWKQKPFSIVPLKKTGRAIIHYLKGK